MTSVCRKQRLRGAQATVQDCLRSEQDSEEQREYYSISKRKSF